MKLSTPCVVRHLSNNGARVAIVVRVGSKHVHLVEIFDDGVKAIKVPVTTDAKVFKALDYKPKAAARKMIKAGSRLGMTQTAKDLLKEVTIG